METGSDAGTETDGSDTDAEGAGTESVGDEPPAGALVAAVPFVLLLHATVMARPPTMPMAAALIRRADRVSLVNVIATP